MLRADLEKANQQIVAERQKHAQEKEKLRNSRKAKEQEIRSALNAQVKSLEVEWQEAEKKLRVEIDKLTESNKDLKGDIQALRWKLTADAKSGAASRREASRKVEKGNQRICRMATASVATNS